MDTLYSCDAKKLASKVQNFLEKKDIKLSRSHALECISDLFGYKNWDTLSAQIKKKNQVKTYESELPENCKIVLQETDDKPSGEVDAILVDEMSCSRAYWQKRFEKIGLTLWCLENSDQLLSEIDKKDFSPPKVVVMNEYDHDIKKVKNKISTPVVSSYSILDVIQKYLMSEENLKDSFLKIPCANWTEEELRHVQDRLWINIPSCISACGWGWTLSTGIDPSNINIQDLLTCCKSIGFRIVSNKKVWRKWDDFAFSRNVSIGFDDKQIVLKSNRKDQDFDGIFHELFQIKSHLKKISI